VAVSKALYLRALSLAALEKRRKAGLTKAFIKVKIKVKSSKAAVLYSPYLAWFEHA